MGNERIRNPKWIFYQIIFSLLHENWVLTPITSPSQVQCIVSCLPHQVFITAGNSLARISYAHTPKVHPPLDLPQPLLSEDGRAFSCRSVQVWVQLSLKSTKHCASFPDGRWGWVPAPRYWTHRNFAEVEGPWMLVGLILLLSDVRRPYQQIQNGGF